MTVFVQFILLMLASFSGIFFGILLSCTTNEEISYGRKWLRLLQSIIFFTLLIIFSSEGANVIEKAIFSGISIVIMSIIKNYSSLQPSVIAYAVFGIMSAIMARSSSGNIELIIGLIFLYGLPVGSLLGKHTLEEKSRIYPKLWRYLAYPVFSLVSFAVLNIGQ